MNSGYLLFSRLGWFNLPAVVLLGLLQRSPALRVVAAATDRFANAPLGAMLRAAMFGLSSLGSVHALAGATTLVTNKPSPLTATAGLPLAPVGFGINGPGVGQPGSWVVGGSIPPGLNFSGLTAPATINIANLVLSGIPATAGSYTVTLQGWENKDRKGKGSPVYDYIITVTGGSTATAPSFIAQPGSQIVNVGDRATFSATASGSPTPTYQWLKGGSAIAGATNSLYMIASAQPSDAGAYAVVATNSAGSVTSSAAQLSVNNVVGLPVVSGRLVNLSILTNAGSGASVLTMGAFIGGTGTHGSMPLVIRAVGPTLGTAFGIPGVLADPVMTVNAQGSAVPIAVNNKWGGTATSRAAFAAVGAFPLPDASLDCAYVPPAPGLASGGYTVQVASAGSGTGLVIAEIYDATGTGRTATTPRLVNLSTLAQIDAGATLAVGFVIGGTTSATVVVRAIGPTLGTAFGLGGVMADPELVLFNNNTGLQVAANDDWGGGAALANAMSSVGAFGLADPASRDAVLVMTLPPGAYSARVAGKNGTGGTAIIEVYEKL
jgi:hypothetical protein